MINKEFLDHLSAQVDALKSYRETLDGASDKDKPNIKYEIEQIENDIAWRLDILAHIITQDIPQKIKELDKKLIGLYSEKSGLEEMLTDIVGEAEVNGKYHDIQICNNGVQINER